MVEAGAEWIQIDEPALAVDLPKEWVEAYKDVYATLSKVNAKILLSTYFGSVAEHAALLKALPVDGLHIDWYALLNNWMRSPTTTKSCLPALSTAATSGAPT